MKNKKGVLILSTLVIAIGCLAAVESCNNYADIILVDGSNPVGGGSNSVTDGNGRVTVDIYSFTDFHGILEAGFGSSSNPGAARFIAVVKELMSQSEPGHSLLLSSGDNYHDWDYDKEYDDPTKNTNLSNRFNGKPVADMFKYLGLKYSVIGNHEWDWGNQFDHYSQEGNITFLAANLFLKGTNNRPTFCKPYAIETIAGKKFGIVGLTVIDMMTYTTDFKNQDATIIADYDFRDFSGTWLKDMVTDLKTNQHCDAVIALTHLDQPTVAGLYDKGFDAIILGHTHMITNTHSNAYNVPVVQASHYGRGLAKLSFEFDDNGLVKIEHDSFRNFLTNTYLPVDAIDKDIAAMVASYKN